MSGFAASIGMRLSEAEKIVEESDGEHGLVLVDDFQKATEVRDTFAEEMGFFLGSFSSKRSFDADALTKAKRPGSAATSDRRGCVRARRCRSSRAERESRSRVCRPSRLCNFSCMVIVQEKLHSIWRFDDTT